MNADQKRKETYFFVSPKTINQNDLAATTIAFIKPLTSIRRLYERGTR